VSKFEKVTPAVSSLYIRDDHYPVSNETSDLCEISDLLLFFSYFASQNKKIKSGN